MATSGSTAGIALKICQSCKNVRNLGDFGMDSCRSDGRCPYCKSCKRVMGMTYMRKKRLDPEFVKKEIVRSREYRKTERYRNSPKEWKIDPIKRKASSLKRHYGINLDDYNKMLCEQDGVCAICNKVERSGVKKYLSVDHNHSSGKIRGLLCSLCNALLGLCGDSIDTLEKASNYLREKDGH